MTDDDGSPSDDLPSGTGRAHTADTVPPPAGGDVYNAPTEIRQAPDDLLDIAREFKAARAARIGGAAATHIPPAAGVPSIAAAVADAPAPASEPPSVVTADDAAPPLVAVVAPPPAAALAAPRDVEADLLPSAAPPPRIRQTAVAMLTILVVVTVVLAALSLAITMRGGAPAT